MSGAILARNAWAGDFAKKIAFAACGSPTQSFTADGTEFLGEHGSISTAAALRRVGLSGRVGPGLDPCAAMTTEMTLAPGEAREVIFALGQADSLEEVHRLISEYTQSRRAHAALTQVQEKWDCYLNALHVTTPDPGIDLMLNRWLLYQALSCRIWGRSAFYQSSGAFGFAINCRMCWPWSTARPQRRERKSCNRRPGNLKGDVQHWWHPPSGGGVRTRISDDLYSCRSIVTTML